MGVNIEAFEKRWDTVSRETLSVVRRQFGYRTFDISAVYKVFRSGCSEWFDGELGPHVWFESLEEQSPEKSREFKNYIDNIRFNQKSFSKPSMALCYLLTLLSLPLCYFLLDCLTDMGFLSKTLTTIGTAVLVWYAFQAMFKSKVSGVEEKVVDSYRYQLDEHLKALKKILS